MILVISPKNTWAAKRLAEEAVKAGVKIKFVTADKVNKISVENFEVLYIRNPFVKGSPEYLADVIKLARRFTKSGKKVVDKIIASGNIAQGKRADYQALKKANLPIPNLSIVHGRDLRTNGFPFILKWIYGMKGKNVYLIKDKKQLENVLFTHPKNEWIIEKFIKAAYEYKVITVGYKSLPLVSRFGANADGFRIDFKKHKTIKKSAIPKAVKLAEKASKVLGRELAKVDILESKGKYYILEVNRFPGLEWYEKLTKFNATSAFLRYLQKPLF